MFIVMLVSSVQWCDVCYMVITIAAVCKHGYADCY